MTLLTDCFDFLSRKVKRTRESTYLDWLSELRIFVPLEHRIKPELQDDEHLKVGVGDVVSEETHMEEEATDKSE